MGNVKAFIANQKLLRHEKARKEEIFSDFFVLDKGLSCLLIQTWKRKFYTLLRKILS